MTSRDQSGTAILDLVFVRWITQKIFDVIIVSTSGVIISQKSRSYTEIRDECRTDVLENPI